MSDDDADLVAAIQARARRRSRPTGTTDNATVPSTHHIPAVDDNTDTELAIAARRMRMNTPADIQSALRSALRRQSASGAPTAPRPTPATSANLTQSTSRITRILPAAPPATTPPAPPPTNTPHRHKHFHSQKGASRPSLGEMRSAPPVLRHRARRLAEATSLVRLVPRENLPKALSMSPDDTGREHHKGFAAMLRDQLADDKGDLVAARTTLELLLKYLQKTEVRATSETILTGRVSDFCLGQFLDGPCGETKHSRRRRRVALLLLEKACGFDFDIGARSKRKAIGCGGRTAPRKYAKGTAEPRALRHLELLAADNSQSSMVRASAGQAACGGNCCLRYENLQRCGKWRVRGAFLMGVCAADYKKAIENCLWRDLCGTLYGVSGTAEWAHWMISSLHGVEDEMYVLRETNSPSGDASLASCFLNGPMTHDRAIKMLRALLRTPLMYRGRRETLDLSPYDLKHFTYKWLRRFLPALCRTLGEKEEDVNEIGAWAGSEAEHVHRSDLERATGQATAARHDCARLYSTDGAAARVPFIMERNSSIVRRVFASHAVPAVGGLATIASLAIRGTYPPALHATHPSTFPLGIRTFPPLHISHTALPPSPMPHAPHTYTPPPPLRPSTTTLVPISSAAPAAAQDALGSETDGSWDDSSDSES